MNQHDFRRIIRAANKAAIRVAVVVTVVIAAGCTNSSLKLGGAPESVTQARVPAIQRSSEAGGDEAVRAAGMAMPTLTELKHFVVYQRFHGLLNAPPSDGPGAQSSGGSGASADGSATGQRSGAGDAASSPAGDVFSCLPFTISTQDGKGK